MNYKSITLIVAFFATSFNLQSQCIGEAPLLNFTVVPDILNLGKSFLQINWSSGIGDEMPELTCGLPGTPPLLSNISSTVDMDELSVTINGTDVLLYDRGSTVACLGGTFGLKYGLLGNTYITNYSSTLFTQALLQETLSVFGLVSGGVGFNCIIGNSDSPAPLELVHFKGEPSERSNKINWLTSSEENLLGFEVEKSGDGKHNVQSMGTLSAKGFSNNLEYYELEDRNPFPLTYYRLRSIDFDGSENFSDWIAVERKTEENNRLQVFPLPLGEEDLQVYYQANGEEQVIITLSDINGRVLYKDQKSLEPGVYNWNIASTDFDQDLLVLRIHSRAGIQSKLIPKVSLR